MVKSDVNKRCQYSIILNRKSCPSTSCATTPGPQFTLFLQNQAKVILTVVVSSVAIETLMLQWTTRKGLWTVVFKTSNF